MNDKPIRRYVAVAVLLWFAAATLPAGPDASILSRSYFFKEGVTLEIAAEIESDLRLDSVRFVLEREGGMRRFLQSSKPRVEVAISNTSDTSRRVGIAVAVTDDDGALLGVASGGSRLMPVRGKEQATYVLQFDHVNRHLARGSRFLIVVETR